MMARGKKSAPAAERHQEKTEHALSRAELVHHTAEHVRRTLALIGAADAILGAARSALTEESDRQLELARLLLSEAKVSSAKALDRLHVIASAAE